MTPDFTPEGARTTAFHSRLRSQHTECHAQGTGWRQKALGTRHLTPYIATASHSLPYGNSLPTARHSTPAATAFGSLKTELFIGDFPHTNNFLIVFLIRTYRKLEFNPPPRPPAGTPEGNLRLRFAHKEDSNSQKVRATPSKNPTKQQRHAAVAGWGCFSRFFLIRFQKKPAGSTPLAGLDSRSEFDRSQAGARQELR